MNIFDGRAVGSYVLECEFELHSRYYILFRTNIVEKSRKPYMA